MTPIGTRLATLSLVVACAATGITCGSSPTTPGSGTSTSGTNTAACRTYATAANVVTTSSAGGSTNALLTGAFSASTNQSTITSLFANGGLCATTVNTYRSTADFVDEVRVIPPVALPTLTSTTNSAACGSGTAIVTYSYDSQRRLTQFASAGGTTTFTAWDASGRPTTGTESTGRSLSYVYNDTARTLTLTATAGGVASVSTTTFDANGTNVLVVSTTGGTTSTTTYTVTSSDKVCK